MRFSRRDSVAIIALLILVVTGILVMGFRFRPRWPYAEAIAEKYVKEQTSAGSKELTPEEREQQRNCFINQMAIRSAITSYEARERRQPPLTIIDERHPLIEKGYLRNVPSCPTTGKKYKVIHPIDYLPPTTECPSHIEIHYLP